MIKETQKVEVKKLRIHYISGDANPEIKTLCLFDFKGIGGFESMTSTLEAECYYLQNVPVGFQIDVYKMSMKSLYKFAPFSWDLLFYKYHLVKYNISKVQLNLSLSLTQCISNSCQVTKCLSVCLFGWQCQVLLRDKKHSFLFHMIFFSLLF